MISDIRPDLFPEPYVFAAGEAPAGVDWPQGPRALTLLRAR